MEYRKCKKCGVVKPLTEDFWNWCGKNEKKLRIVCKECANKQRMDIYYYGYADHKEENKKVKFIMETQKPKYPFTSYAAMTKNKIYEVKVEDGDCYILKDDAGKVVRLSKARFKVATLDEILRSEFE